MKKMTRGEFIFSIFNTIFMICVTLVFILPIWHVFCASVSDPAALVQSRGLLLKPIGGFNLTGYRLALKNGSIVRGYLNTIFYTTVATFIGMLGSSVMAYALSRPNLMWKNAIAFLLSFTMLFSGGMIPTYLLVRNIHMLNTVWAVILPGCLSVFLISEAPAPLPYPYCAGWRDFRSLRTSVFSPARRPLRKPWPSLSLGPGTLSKKSQTH